jgi:perosamine synthetase
MEQLPGFLAVKARVAARYAAFCREAGVAFVAALPGTTANHWLNAIVLGSEAQRDDFLAKTNAAGVMTRPIWRLMTRLAMFAHCQHDGLEHSRWLEARVVNLPSSVPDGGFVHDEHP